MSNFNPYREWLGIKTRDNVSYYQLLGVRREDSNNRIREQAKRLLRMLKQIDAGDHETEKQKLIDRVSRAARRLTDPVKRKAYDRSLAAQARREKPQPAPKPNRVRKDDRRADQESEPTKTHDESVSEPAAHLGDLSVDALDKVSSPTLSHAMTQEPVRHDAGKTVTDELLRLRPRKSNIAPAYKAVQRRSRSMKLSLFLAAISFIGIGYLVLTQTQLGEQWLATVLPSVNATALGNSATASLGDDLDDVPPLHNDQIDAAPRSTPEPTATTATEPTATTTSEVGNSKLSPNGSMGSQPSVPAQTVPLQELPSAPKLLESLRTAKRMLADRQVYDAQQTLEEARALATHPLWRARLARMTTLTSYVASYWNAAEKQVASFKPGNEATIGDTRVMVVEKTKSQLVVRNAGRNQTIDLTNIPQNLAETLAEDWLDHQSPSTNVFRGAMKAVTPGHDVADAFELWRKAEASGELSLRDLTQVLNELSEY